VQLRDREHPEATPVVWHSHSGMVTGVAISGDGRWVVSAGSDGVIRVRDREHPEAAPQGWPGRQALITSIATSGDGRWVGSGGDNGTVWVWDRKHLEVPPLMWRGHETSINGLALSRDGRWLISGQGDGTLWIGMISAADLKAKACKFAGRNLSGAEWQLYLGDEPYRATCPGQLRPDKSDDEASKSSPPNGPP
jgi:WD40 domain-containing protein